MKSPVGYVQAAITKGRESRMNNDELKCRLNNLELEAYEDIHVGKELLDKAEGLLDDILDSLDGDYTVFNPGEPGLYESDDLTHMVMPLTGENPENFFSLEEEECTVGYAFDTRIVLAHCRDILEYSWSHDLMFKWEIDNGDDS